MRLRLPSRPRRARLALSAAVLVVLGGAGALAVYAAVVVGNTDRLVLSPSPRSRQVVPGKSTTYRLKVHREVWAGAVKLRITTRLPAGVSATILNPVGRPGACAGASGPRKLFTHRVCWYRLAPRQSRVLIRVRTSTRTRVGVFRLRVRGVRYGGTTTGVTSLFLVVKRRAATPPAGVGGAGSTVPAPTTTTTPAPVTPTATTPAPAPPEPAGEPFPIKGDVVGLVPGRTLPLDLEVANDRPTFRLITALGVALGELSAPAADAAHPCGPEDFALTQMPAEAFPIVLPPGTHRLSALGVPATQWPQVTMVNRPLDQDGCQQAQQRLLFTGAAAEAP